MDLSSRPEFSRPAIPTKCNSVFKKKEKYSKPFISKEVVFWLWKVYSRKISLLWGWRRWERIKRMKGKSSHLYAS